MASSGESLDSVGEVVRVDADWGPWACPACCCWDTFSLEEAPLIDGLRAAVRLHSQPYRTQAPQGACSSHYSKGKKAEWIEDTCLAGKRSCCAPQNDMEQHFVASTLRDTRAAAPLSARRPLNFQRDLQAPYVVGSKGRNDGFQDGAARRDKKKRGAQLHTFTLRRLHDTHPFLLFLWPSRGAMSQ